jgi:hypothetical protein
MSTNVRRDTGRPTPRGSEVASVVPASLAPLLLSFPTVLYTVPLVVVLGYWALVMFGALDLDGDGAAGGDDLQLTDAGHGDPGHVHHGADDLAHDAGADDAGDGGLVTSLLSFLGLGRVPLAVWLSLLLFGGWSVSLLGLALAGPALGTPLEWPLRTGLFAASIVVALIAARTLSAPLAALFRTERGTSRVDVLGQECVLVTGRVDKGFGQADLYTGGSALRVEVRCDRDHGLKAGDRVLVAYYDEARAAYVIEPMLSPARRASHASSSSHPTRNQEQNNDVR